MSLLLSSLLLEAEPTNIPTVDLGIERVQLVTTGGVVLNSGLLHDDEVDLTQGPITITAVPLGNPGSIVFKLDGVEINRANFVANAPFRILPNRVYKRLGFYEIKQDPRPLDFGEGYRTLEVIPYSGSWGTGTPGSGYSINLRFTNGSPVTPNTTVTNVANQTQFVAAIAGGDDYETIKLGTGTFDCSGYTPSIDKRLKIIGSGTGTILENVSSWDLQTGITLGNLKIDSGGISFILADGVSGFFAHDITLDACNRFVRLDDPDSANGMALHNIVGFNFIGTRPSVCDCFGQIDNVSIRNCDIRILVSSSGAVQVFRIGSDTGTITNHDIIFEHNYIDDMRPNLSLTGEVHGAHIFGNYAYIFNNTIKNITTDVAHSDHEGLDCKGDYQYIAYNWIHNGGAEGQEGHLNKKDSQIGGVIEHNLITSNQTSDTGQGMTVHGENIIRFNTIVLQYAHTNEGAGALLRLYDTNESFWHDNLVITNGGKFSRHSNTTGGSSIIHVYNNTGRHKNLQTEGVFYLNSNPSNVTILQDGGDDMCPATGKDGSACFDFTLADWTVNYQPQGDFLIEYSTASTPVEDSDGSFEEGFSVGMA